MKRVLKMARFTIRTGRRGRPLTLDTEELTTQFMKSFAAAKSTLAQIRRKTSGVRDTSILGTPTSLPEWLETTYQIISSGIGQLDYISAKELKAGVKATRQLASRVEKSRQQALSDIMYNQYTYELDTMISKSSEQAKDSYDKLKQRIQSLNKIERQKFFTSKFYESPKAFGGKEYEKILAWSKKETGKEAMTFQEAGAYLLYRRAIDGLDNSSKQEAVFGG